MQIYSKHKSWEHEKYINGPLGGLVNLCADWTRIEPRNDKKSISMTKLFNVVSKDMDFGVIQMM